MSKTNRHSLSAEEVFKKIKTNRRGLSEEEAEKRFKRFGANKLPEEKKLSRLAIFFDQFKSPLVYVLLGAGLISFFLNLRNDFKKNNVNIIIILKFLKTIKIKICRG